MILCVFYSTCSFVNAFTEEIKEGDRACLCFWDTLLCLSCCPVWANTAGNNCAMFAMPVQQRVVHINGNAYECLPENCDEILDQYGSVILDPCVYGCPVWTHYQSMSSPRPWQWPRLAQAWGSQAPVRVFISKDIQSQMNTQMIPAMLIYIWMTLIACEFAWY